MANAEADIEVQNSRLMFTKPSIKMLKWNGESSIDMFLDRLDDQFGYSNITEDAEKRYHLLCALPDHVYTMLKNEVRDGNFRSQSYDAMVQLLIKRFRKTKTRTNALMTLLRCQQQVLTAHV
ncbi:hypothetical protein TrispH2_006530 [Trichoplax sp. H2]|nr:hypothetical protein TrispH2_006530 [Trichoplax sp. H2]|eukprot:RDD42366.1 hypothetical protein TrispH2_006530 [Trichoplax sp. H2]